MVRIFTWRSLLYSYPEWVFVANRWLQKGCRIPSLLLYSKTPCFGRIGIRRVSQQPAKIPGWATRCSTEVSTSLWTFTGTHEQSNLVYLNVNNTVWQFVHGNVSSALKEWIQLREVLRKRKTPKPPWAQKFIQSICLFIHPYLVLIIVPVTTHNGSPTIQTIADRETEVARTYVSPLRLQRDVSAP